MIFVEGKRGQSVGLASFTNSDNSFDLVEVGCSDWSIFNNPLNEINQYESVISWVYPDATSGVKNRQKNGCWCAARVRSPFPYRYLISMKQQKYSTRWGRTYLYRGLPPGASSTIATRLTGITVSRKQLWPIVTCAAHRLFQNVINPN